MRRERREGQGRREEGGRKEGREGKKVEGLKGEGEEGGVDKEVGLNEERKEGVRER